MKLLLLWTIRLCPQIISQRFLCYVTSWCVSRIMNGRSSNLGGSVTSELATWSAWQLLLVTWFCEEWENYAKSLIQRLVHPGDIYWQLLPVYGRRPVQDASAILVTEIHLPAPLGQAWRATGTDVFRRPSICLHTRPQPSPHWLRAQAQLHTAYCILIVNIYKT